MLRNELAPFGIDAALINPGPFASGFNERMANHPGDWFDRKTADAEEAAIMDSLVKRITVGQLDPADVVMRRDPSHLPLLGATRRALEIGVSI